jgi:hypothetical protein
MNSMEIWLPQNAYCLLYGSGQKMLILKKFFNRMVTANFEQSQAVIIIRILIEKNIHLHIEIQHLV